MSDTGIEPGCRGWAAAPRQRDRGMTLPELLIAVTVAGLIVGVLATSIIVTLRQQDNTEGRLNVARAEQNVSMWMPADLSSAESVDTSPEATPCGSATCDGIYLGNGSNVLMLEWTEVGEGDGAVCPPEGMSNCTVHRVSYNFYPAPDGELYELRRVECVTTDLVGWSCEEQIVLRELPGPPGGKPFVAGVGEGAAACAARAADTAQEDCTRPTWVIVVSEPLDPCAGLTGAEFTACVGTGEDGTQTKDANRVVVSINGGGDGSGAGGGVNQISITAGGTARRTITADSMTGAPSFLEARSRCGGPLTLIIDQSTSIPDYARPRVRSAAIEFARLLRGTPVDIQVIEFDYRADTLGDGQSINPEPGWHEYFEMSEPADWTKLETLLAGMAFNGATNWEDALFRTLYNPDGTTPQIVPETIVFFTDGVPTVSRQSYRADPGIPATSPIYEPTLWRTWNGSSWQNGETGSAYNQGAFNRADNIAARVRAEQAGYVRMIGVGVGGINGNVRWVSNPGAGYKTVWEHGYGRYQQGSPEYWSNHDFEELTSLQSRVDYEQATYLQARQDYEHATRFQARLDYEHGSKYQARLDYERRVSANNWEDTDPRTYYTNNTTSGESDGWRIGSTNRSWYDISEADYRAYRSQSASNFQIASWDDTDPRSYYTNNTTTDDVDGWRIRNSNGTRSWYDISETDYRDFFSRSTSNFQALNFVDTDPRSYYTNNTTSDSSDGWRIGGTNRAWYNISLEDYQDFVGVAGNNFRADWADRTPTEYFTNYTSGPGYWRINGTRSWYGITAAEYNAYAPTSPSNYQGSWKDRTPTEYYTNQPASPATWRINGTRTWYTVTEAEYNAYHGTDTSVNWRPQTAWTWVSKAVYDAGIATNPSGFRDTGSNTSLDVAVAPEFEIVASQGYPSSHYRQRRVYPGTGPFTGVENPVYDDTVLGKELLARLISGDSIGTPYLEVADEDGSDNAEIANMFIIEGNDDAAWAKLTPAMKAIALGECGGTLTLATKTSSGAAVSAPFTYENSAVFRSDGSPVTPFQPNVVTTNAQYRTRGFDYAVPGGTYITSEIRPQASSVLLRYQPLGWECRAGARVLGASEINEQPIELEVTNPDGTTTTVPSGWTKIAVRIAANEAVSCVLKVAQTS